MTFYLFAFMVAICELVHMWRLYMTYDNCKHHIELCFEICVKSEKLQFAIVPASLVVQKIFEMLLKVNGYVI